MSSILTSKLGNIEIDKNVLAQLTYKAVVDGSPKRVSVCTRCLRSGKVERA